jgi:hypothetical protein
VPLLILLVASTLFAKLVRRRTYNNTRCINSTQSCRHRRRNRTLACYLPSGRWPLGFQPLGFGFVVILFSFLKPVDLLFSSTRWKYFVYLKTCPFYSSQTPDFFIFCDGPICEPGVIISVVCIAYIYLVFSLTRMTTHLLVPLDSVFFKKS